MYTRARTRSAAVGGSYVNNPLALAAPAPPLPPGTPAVFYISAADYPLTRNDPISVVPSATYKHQQVGHFAGLLLVPAAHVFGLEIPGTAVWHQDELFAHPREIAQP